MPLFCHCPIVTAPPIVRKRSNQPDDARRAREELRLVTQALLMTILPHPLAAFVFGDLGFSFFLERTHKTNRGAKPRQAPIQPLAAPNCN
jgi:hypothetical protein